MHKVEADNFVLVELVKVEKYFLKLLWHAPETLYTIAR
jgi:hypothetical protein